MLNIIKNLIPQLVTNMIKKLLLFSILLTACINSNGAEVNQNIPNECMVYDATTNTYIVLKYLAYKPTTQTYLWKEVRRKPCLRSKAVVVFDESGKNKLIWDEKSKKFISYNPSK